MTVPSTISSATPATLARCQSAGLESLEVEHSGVCEWHVTVRPLPGETPEALVLRLSKVLARKGAVVLRQEVFGSLDVRDSLMRAIQDRFGVVDWPVGFVEGRSCGGELLSGMHFLAVSGSTVETVWLRGRPVGRTFRDCRTRHLLLGDLRPDDASQEKPGQARKVLEDLEAGLGLVGMTMANVARTWFFLDDLLSWYGPFNEVRTGFFHERKVFGGLMPASTGVSGANANGSAALVGAWAVESLGEGFSVSAVESPLQCSARSYGSSFSRAVEFETPEWRRLLISGTASIEPDGASVHLGDVVAQIDLSMEVVRAILRSRGMDFADASRVTAYFKHPSDAVQFDRWRDAHGLMDWPVLCVQADICREELLFEVEMDAILAKPDSGERKPER